MYDGKVYLVYSVVSAASLILRLIKRRTQFKNKLKISVFVNRIERFSPLLSRSITVRLQRNSVLVLGGVCVCPKPEIHPTYHLQMNIIKAFSFQSVLSLSDLCHRRPSIEEKKTCLFSLLLEAVRRFHVPRSTWRIWANWPKWATIPRALGKTGHRSALHGESRDKHSLLLSCTYDSCSACILFFGLFGEWNGVGNWISLCGWKERGERKNRAVCSISVMWRCREVIADGCQSFALPALLGQLL